MLRKLTRYEFLATGRIFLPLYGAFLVMSFILRGFMELQSTWQIQLEGVMNLLSIIPYTLYVCLFIATVAGSVLVAIRRFYKNLMSEEGYLMFTLPVKTRHLVLSKLFAAIVWSIVSALVCIVSIMILAFTPDAFRAIGYWWSEMVRAAYIQGFSMDFVLLLEVILAILAELVYLYMSIYAAISATNFVNRHRVWMGIGVYILINIVSQIINTLLTIGQWTATQGSVVGVILADQVNGYIHGILLQSIIVSLILSAALFVGTNWVLKKKSGGACAELHRLPPYCF